ncbi:MAG TPA: hypothetical protein VFS08_02280 [Gemmatimonadaceae bacterium]|nr:hypothetical protein [Gemmatimonadaceae bacterium]
MSLYKEDKPAAFTGLIAGAVLVLAMVLVIVHFTNLKFAGHEGSEPAAQTTH